jgi:hypothetical protein
MGLNGIMRLVAQNMTMCEKEKIIKELKDIEKKKEEKKKKIFEFHKKIKDSKPNNSKKIYYVQKDNDKYICTDAQASNSTTAYFGGNNVTPDPEYVQGVLNGSGPVTINGYGIEINGESE